MEDLRFQLGASSHLVVLDKGLELVLRNVKLAVKVLDLLLKGLLVYLAVLDKSISELIHVLANGGEDQASSRASIEGRSVGDGLVEKVVVSHHVILTVELVKNLDKIIGLLGGDVGKALSNAGSVLLSAGNSKVLDKGGGVVLIGLVVHLVGGLGLLDGGRHCSR